jgi:hypothetical protein
MVNTSNLPPAVQLACSRMLLATPTPYYIYRFAAMKRTMDRNSGGTTRMRRYNPLPASLAPLGNLGITPPPTQPSIVDIDAKVSFYGAYMYVNEQVVLQNQEDKMYVLYKSSLIDLETEVAFS